MSSASIASSAPRTALARAFGLIPTPRHPRRHIIDADNSVVAIAKNGRSPMKVRPRAFGRSPETSR